MDEQDKVYEKGKPNKAGKRKKDVMRELVHLFSPQHCVPDKNIDSQDTVCLTSLPEAGTGSETHTDADTHKSVTQPHSCLFIFHGKTKKH